LLTPLAKLMTILRTPDLEAAQTRLRLSIISALSLEAPRAANELERRFLDPCVQRAFAGVPELVYIRDLRASGCCAESWRWHCQTVLSSQLEKRELEFRFRRYQP